MPQDHLSDRLADRRSCRSAGRRLDRVLLRWVDAGLAGCVFVVPFLMGGRQALGQLALVTLAVVVAVAWLLHQSMRPEGTWRWTAGNLVFLAGIGLLVAQLVPWPPEVRNWLAPHTAQLLPLWTSGGDPAVRLSAWEPVSLTPSATQEGLVLFLAYALLFATAAQRIRAIEDVERLLRWCALSAMLMAAFGLVQFVTSNGKFFWVFEHPYSSTCDVAKGAFTNRNHFAHFLALGIGPFIWWIQHHLRTSRHQRRGDRFGKGPAFSQLEWGSCLRMIGLGIVLFAGLLSLSRGGMLVMMVACMISVAVCYRASSLGIRFVASLGAAALLIGAALMVFGYDRVVERMDDFTAGSIEQLDAKSGRRTIWEATLKAIPAYWPLGAGVGSLQQVYPMHVETHDVWQFYTHAENGPLQVTLETGVAGLALTILAILLCAFWCVACLRGATSKRTLVCGGAVSAALAANVIHSFFDFVWYVPGCMAMVALLAACACRLREMPHGKPLDRAGQRRLPRAVGLVATLAVMLLGVWMVRGRLGPVAAEQAWFQYLRMARTPIACDTDGGNRADSRAQGAPLRAANAGRPDRETEASHGLTVRLGPMDGRLPDAVPAAAPADDARDSAESAAQAMERSLENQERKMIAALEEVLRWEPDHLEANLRLAENYLALFDRRQQTAVNQMPLSAISDTVMKERFASREAMDQWLARAVGEHRVYLDNALYRCRRALSLCPLAGEGYLYLSDLCFLEGAAAASKEACVQQALRVRPYDGKVLFHAGRQAALAGDLEQCAALWRRAFRAGKIHQWQIVEGLTRRLRPENPQEEIHLLLAAFQPDLYGLRLLNGVYGKTVAPDLLVELRWAYVRAVEAEAALARDKEAAELWLEALGIYGQLNEGERAVECGRRGLACDPHHYWLHHHLARCLAAQERFAEAEEMLRWCVARKPDDRGLNKLLHEVVKQRIAQKGPRGLASRRIGQDAVR